jgi:nicotinamidase-related amidase
VPLVDRDDSLLVVVDTQKGFFDHDEMSRADRAEAARTVQRIAWMAGVAALLDIPAVVTEESAGKNGPTDATVLDRLPPGTPVLDKPTFGLADTRAIVDAVRATGRSTAVLVGFETDVCVAQSAIGLQELGLRTVVLEDAMWSNSEQQHHRGLARMRAVGIERNDCKGLVFEWLRTVEVAHDVFPKAEKFGDPPWLL